MCSGAVCVGGGWVVQVIELAYSDDYCVRKCASTILSV